MNQEFIDVHFHQMMFLLSTILTSVKLIPIDGISPTINYDLPMESIVTHDLQWIVDEQAILALEVFL